MTTSLNLCHGKSVVFVMQLISWYHIHYWITSNSLVDSFLIGEVLNSHTKSKKPTMSYEPLRKTPTRCVQSCPCTYTWTWLPVWILLQLLLLLLLSFFHCLCVDVLLLWLLLLMLLLYLKMIRWSGSRVWETWNLSPILFSSWDSV